ncbi:MAG: hypothetical protein COA49_10165 [Bacteroidetes bacterium]|nr:MAG: hypothetical protein COA49_10165 [Bacteroidota bacterium]
MQNEHKHLVNGTITDINRLPSAFNNRGFLYADGFFDSMRLINSTIPLFDLHFGRITDSLSAYQISISPSLEKETLLNSLIELASKTGFTKGARIRLTIYRGGGGKFSPKNNVAEWVASIERAETEGFELNSKGAVIGLFQDLTKTPDKFSNFKNINSTISIQASLFASKNKLGDALILNNDLKIIEATSSNIFLVSKGTLYTPKLSSGAVGGVMRAYILNLAIELGIKIFECTLTPQELLKADEVFLTNAISGVRWVASYRTKRYFNKMSSMLLRELNSRIYS